MITDERIASFINSFNSDYDDVITAIRKEAEEQEVPIIRREAGEFIKLLMMIKKPVNILEIGTAVGFSAIFMSRFLREEGHIKTRSFRHYRDHLIWCLWMRQKDSMEAFFKKRSHYLLRKESCCVIMYYRMETCLNPGSR